MRGGKVRKLLVLAALGAVVAAVVRALRGDPAPQFSTHPTVLGGPDLGRATGPVDEPPAPAATPVADDPAEATPAPEPEPVPADAEAPTAGGAQLGVDPVDGACPDGYPIKGKRSSGIYHQPGGLAYERTKPDRCYATAADAEADGLRPAKR